MDFILKLQADADLTEDDWQQVRQELCDHDLLEKAIYQWSKEEVKVVDIVMKSDALINDERTLYIKMEHVEEKEFALKTTYKIKITSVDDVDVYVL